MITYNKKGSIVFSVLSVLILVSIFATGCASQPTATTAPVAAATTAPVAAATTAPVAAATTAPVATATTAPVTNGKSYVIGLSNFSLGNSWRVQMVAEAEYAAKQNSQVLQLIVTQADNSVEKQIADMEDLITSKVDAILLTAINPDALTPEIDKAIAAGIVVVGFDNLTNDTNVTANIVVDQKQFGATQATWLVKALGGKGDIIAFNGQNGTQISADRFAGAKSVFDQNPGIKIVDTEYANWDYATAKTAMESLIVTYPDIAGVWSQGGAMSQAVIDTFVEAGKNPPPVTGEDGNGFLKTWKTLYDKNGYDSIATSMPTWVSAQALTVALAALNKQPFDKSTLLPIPTITAATLDQYVRPNLSDSFWCNSHLPDSVVQLLFPQ
jgi:ribose transport system substrate-binding protein